MQQILLMNAEIGRGNVRLTRCQQLNAAQETVYTKTAGKLIWNKKASGRLSTLISPRELHKELDDIGFITAEHWWRAGWAKVLTRGNERVISHWLRAHHRRSRMLRGRWPLSCDCLDEETYGGGQVCGVKHTQMGHKIQEKGKPSHTQTLPYLHTLPSAHICLYRQLDGDGDGDDAGRGPGCIQVTYVKCHLFPALSFLLLNP